MQIKSLLRETYYYSFSSIILRVFNIAILPLYTLVMPSEGGEYGLLTSIYATSTLVMVFLGAGMETTMLRFANKPGVDPSRVYSTALITVFSLCILFFCGFFFFAEPFAVLAETPGLGGTYQLMAAILVFDTFLTLPFCYLRYQNKARAYCTYKIMQGGINFVLNIYVLYFCPRLLELYPDSFLCPLWDFWMPDNTLSYILGCNLVSSAIMIIVMLDYWKPFGHFHTSTGESISFQTVFDYRLFLRMMRYALPILGIGVLNVMIQNVDRVIYPWLFDADEGIIQVGIYGASFRIAMIMALATQVLRDLVEPTLFHFSNKQRGVEISAILIVRYFLICSITLFLIVMASMSIFKRFLLQDPTYWDGMRVIPILMIAEVMLGVQYAMSFWYKIGDKPIFGTIFELISLIVIVTGMVLFIPTYGYMACAWSIFAGTFTRLLLTILAGFKYSPYQVLHKANLTYVGIGLACFGIIEATPDLGLLWNTAIGFAIVFVFVYIMVLSEQSQLDLLSDGKARS